MLMTVFFLPTDTIQGQECVADTFKYLFCSKIHKMIFIYKDKNNKCHFPLISKVWL